MGYVDDVVSQWPIIEDTPESGYYVTGDVYNRSRWVGFLASSGVNENTRSYLEVSGGTIKFGYRNANSNAKNLSYTLSAYRYSSAYYGISINAPKIQIANGESLETPLLRLNYYYGETGYMEVITQVTGSASSPLVVTEYIPFICGICVANR